MLLYPVQSQTKAAQALSWGAVKIWPLKLNLQQNYVSKQVLK